MCTHWLLLIVSPHTHMQEDTSWVAMKTFLGKRSVKEDILNYDAHRIINTPGVLCACVFAWYALCSSLIKVGALSIDEPTHDLADFVCARHSVCCVDAHAPVYVVSHSSDGVPGHLNTHT